jgi:hypothetical protein
MELKSYVSEELVNFKEECWKDEYFQWMLDFLNDPANKTLYFWCDFKDVEAGTLFVANTRPPTFFDEGIKGENYNVVCFIKKNDVD